MVPTPVVELNRAVAVGMADGPEAGLRLVDALEHRAPWPATTCSRATRADLLRRSSRHAEAAAGYARRSSGGTDAERRYLARRLDEAEQG